MKRALLAAIQRARGPFAWACLVGGVVLIPLTVAGIVFGDEPVAAIFGTLLLMLDGYEQVRDVEDVSS